MLGIGHRCGLVRGYATWMTFIRMNIIILYVVAEKVGNQTSFRLLGDGLLEDPLTACLETSLENLTRCHFRLLSSLQTLSRSFL